jgi:hypothetical protein
MALHTPVPIPQLDGHVVRGRQQVWQRGVHCHRSNVVLVRLKRLYLFGRVIIKDAYVHVLQTRTRRVKETVTRVA